MLQNVQLVWKNNKKMTLHFICKVKTSKGEVVEKAKVMEQTKEFDPLDMSHYTLEKLPKMPKGKIMVILEKIGFPLAMLVFFYYHFQWGGTIDVFEAQTKIAPAMCYSMLGIFFASLILWISEAIPNYVTSLMLIVAVVVIGVFPEKKAYAYLGHKVMILNIASFILASMLVASGIAKRIALKFIMKAGHHSTPIFWAFLILNLGQLILQILNLNILRLL